jgi:hypothetical protein
MSVDDRLHQAEFVIGYAVPGYLAGQPDQYFSKESGHIAFEDTSRSLHSCSTEIGAIIHVSTFAKELGLFLQQTGRELDRTELSRPTDNVHNVDVLRYKESLEQKIEFSINLYTSILSQTAILKQRVQNHINLTFSLIAQDENRVARSMARESALIAVATKRDSTAMKTIALLTIVFLPPTFVATFFSMTMFDWKPQDQDSGVASKYLWVYWVVSIPLTAFVLLCWRVWLKMEDKKYQTELNTAKLQNPGRPKEYTLTLSGDVRANRRRQAHSPGSIAWSDA